MFWLFFCTFLATPFATPLAAWRLSRQAPLVQRRALAIGLSTASVALNVVLWVVAWIAFAVLGMSAFRLRPKVLGYALGSLAALPGIAGLLFATVGVMALKGLLRRSPSGTRNSLRRAFPPEAGATMPVPAKHQH